MYGRFLCDRLATLQLPFREKASALGLVWPSAAGVLRLLDKSIESSFLVKPHCLPLDALEENFGGTNDTCAVGTRNPLEPDSLPDQKEVCPNPETPKLMIRQRCGKLFDELDLSGLDLWAPEMEDKARQLLAKYHELFSLDQAELGCTHSTEHAIKVTDDTPFKEHFRRIPLLMVDEVRNHLREMLESGAIRPSQSAWCNARHAGEEKGWWLTILYRLLTPECPYKEEFLSVTPNTGGTGDLGRCWPLLLP